MILFLLMFLKYILLNVKSDIIRLPCGYYANFTKYYEFKTDGNITKKFTSSSYESCSLQCFLNDGCKSVNYRLLDGQCHLMSNQFDSLIANENWMHGSTELATFNVNIILHRCFLPFCAK